MKAGHKKATGRDAPVAVTNGKARHGTAGRRFGRPLPWRVMARRRESPQGPAPPHTVRDSSLFAPDGDFGPPLRLHILSPPNSSGPFAGTETRSFTRFSITQPQRAIQAKSMKRAGAGGRCPPPGPVPRRLSPPHRQAPPRAPGSTGPTGTPVSSPPPAWGGGRSAAAPGPDRGPGCGPEG